VAALTLSAASASADALGLIVGAFAEAKPIIDARLRFESVDQTPLTKEAHADTLRLRLGFETGKAWSTALLAEGELVTPIGDDYRADNSRAENLRYPAVADPESYEINRLQLVNTSIPGTTVTVGRQRIVLDDQRFVGNGGWRQSEQTYDAVRIVNKTLPALTIDATYLNQVNRIFGPDSPQGRYTGDGVLANVAWQSGFGKLTGFGYLLDFDALTTFPGLTAAQAAALNPVRVSTQTYGLRFAGERPIRSIKLDYAASYARQSNYAANPLRFDLDYYSLEATATYRQYSLTLGQEVLEGDGTVGFSTPLASLHRFQGWADKFLTTPADGIDDRYAGIGCLMKGVAMLDTLSVSVVYHDFESQWRAVELGSELNLQMQAKYGSFLALVKYADFDAKEGATPVQYQDTTKFWVQVEYLWR
jgi:hypothetical protein